MSTPPSAHAIAWSDPARRALFEDWLAGVAQARSLEGASLRAASTDASFRRYFRLDAQSGDGSFIVMDAPPQHEDCEPFVAVAQRLRQAGLHVPEVLEWHREGGFLLLSDLGQQTYLSALQDPTTGAQRSHQLMLDAISALQRMQRVSADDLPIYDEALQRKEMSLFEAWYLHRHLGLTLNNEERGRLEGTLRHILEVTLAQPRVFVHRDYHSRNLMVALPSPGLLDFQDAVHGPITYDLVSLLRDAYIPWDEELQLDYTVRYWEGARLADLPVPADFGDFWRDFEWMGLQRHLKVLGIFARLAHRDGKLGYLDDLPVVWSYAHRVCTRYAPLASLAALLERAQGRQRTSGYTF